MRKFTVNRLQLTVVLLLLLSTIYCPLSTVSAHLAGQPPFFKVDGTYANLYFVPLTSLNDFQLPQDMPSGKYLINKPIQFELDATRLPNASPDVIAKTKFAWNFGDGNKFTGLKTTHSYTKMGSYILTITADDGTTPTPQLLESALINVLPNPNYQLPQAVITVNNKQSQDPLTDVLEFPLGTKLHFDASGSKGNIVSYFWDFGDQQSSTLKTIDHYYPGDLTQIFPVLRVKDSNGFLSDNFVEIQNGNQGNFVTGGNNGINPLTGSPKSTAVKKVSGNQLPIALGVLALIALIAMARWWVRDRYRGKRR